MFLDEMTPIFKELTQQPLAFLGGFCSGLFRLNLSDDPVKSWLDRQANVTRYADPAADGDNGRSRGPQSISID